MRAEVCRIFTVLSLISIAAFATFGILLPSAAAQAECSNPRPRLVIGEQGRVIPGDPNNVRDQPTRNGARIGRIPGGGQFTVLEGPVCAEGLNWWRVESAELVGWTVEGADGTYWTEPLPEDTPAADEPQLIRGQCPHTTDRIVFSTIRTEVRADGQTRYGQLITTDPDGGNACLLTELQGEPAYTDDLLSQPLWSPDGRQIVFRMAASRVSHRLYLINADGTNLRPLTTFDDQFADTAWSPDSQRVTFMSRFDIWVGFADGRGSRRVVEDRGQVMSLSWSPDGQWLAFSVYGRTGEQVYLVSPEGGEPVLIARAEQGWSFSSLVWSPDSAALEVSRPGAGFYRIIVSEVLAGEPLQLVGAAQNQRMSPTYSPDGTQIAFWDGPAMRDSGQPLTLGIINADGGDEAALVRGVRDALPRGFVGIYPPSWSPDGSLLVYGTRSGIYVVEAATSEVMQIWAGEINGAPQFQPGD